jgi:[ribosomal protein S18]-alanine N-acetyltransferase
VTRVAGDGARDVRVRPMRWWDITCAAEIERAVFVDDPWTEAGFWSELAGVPGTRYYVVAEDGSGLVGYAGLLTVAREADVQTVAVRADRQGRGLGGRLVDELLAQARRRDCSQVLLEVRADNAAAQALYEARGFERISLRRGYYGLGLDAVVMRLRLGSAT